MLPKAIIDVTENFVRAYDQEHPYAVQFRNIQQRVLGQASARGFGGFGSAVLVKIADTKVAYVEERAKVIWERLKEVIIATDIDSYPQLASDLTKQMEIWNRVLVEQAKLAVWNLCRQHNVQLSHAPRLDDALNTMRLKMDAEVALFALKHEVATKRRKESSVPSVVYNLHGPNPRVNIGANDFSINVSNSEKIFAELRKAIESAIEDSNLKAELLAKTAELESEIGKGGFMKKYSDFIAAAAKHMTVLGPFVPALTKLLPQ